MDIIIDGADFIGKYYIACVYYQVPHWDADKDIVNPHKVLEWYSVNCALLFI